MTFVYSDSKALDENDAEFISYHTGIRPSALIEHAELSIEIYRKGKPDAELESFAKLCMRQHELGELAYILAHDDEIKKDYSGLKRLFGEIVGDYFARLYWNKNASCINSKIRFSRPVFGTPLRYTIAKLYLQSLWEKSKKEQLEHIQRIIFQSYPQTLRFKFFDNFFSLLEKIGIF